MKTRIAIATCFILFALVFCSRAATVVIKVSEFPNTNHANGTDLFLLAVPGITNKNISYNQLREQLGTNGSPNQIISNLTVIQNFRGRTVLAGDTYTTNLFATNLFVNYTTNILQYTTNLFVTTNHTDVSYNTNLFITTISSNYVVFNTNFFYTPTFVSNYFQTNVFLDTYQSNYFNTNFLLFQTNFFTTYVTSTQIFAADSIVSNFFMTNIFAPGSIVSNYFSTNFFPTTTINSNYTFNVAWPLTNATLYGTTTFSPISGNQSGRIDILSAGVTNISFVGSNSAVQAGVFWFKTNSWSGPTNNLPMNVEDQYYATTTDVNITNLNLLPTTGYSAGVLLSITNSTGANKVLRFPLSIAIPERTNAVTLSNSAVGIFSIRYSPVGPSTQGVYRQF